VLCVQIDPLEGVVEAGATAEISLSGSDAFDSIPIVSWVELHAVPACRMSIELWRYAGICPRCKLMCVCMCVCVCVCVCVLQ
jgi:hypothetical protein